MFNVIGAVFTGLIVGWLARFFYPGAVPMGWIMTVLLGIGGSLLASAVGVWASGGAYRDGVNRAGCLASVVGAMALIFIGRTLL
ncbi:GlsB/YeaQ/YmgE family stress response membrane protein [Novosphingobium piscinae]|uniref:GlsB/YeaQ/YmgE family stress response membrane protein n=1 Tax=Novosphingobium piscinae TaxID=1507448 RepID=A0A7X1FYG4_9SPHN|nr:GlsB/YeaQ/YmgE family stress response membrane protein [Novosphingobium piscinae]MBC2669320.1 GlsB/YeaQ/YmgE family stress response membrane protein [Novosphingobium piscinae]